MKLIFLFGLFVAVSASAVANGQETAQERMHFLLDQKKPAVRGPNCWNSALYISGIAPGVYYSENEIEFWMYSPLCQVAEKPQTGDVVNVLVLNELLKSWVESTHAYIYLDSERGLTKNGPEINADYEVMAHKTIQQLFEVREGCAFLNDPQLARKLCMRTLRAFRCGNLEALAPTLRANEKAQALREIAKRVTAQTFSGKSETQPEDLKTVSEIRAYAAHSLGAPKFAALSPELQRQVSLHSDVMELGGEKITDTSRDHGAVLAYLETYNLQKPAKPQMRKLFREQIARRDLDQDTFYTLAYLYLTADALFKQMAELPSSRKLKGTK